MLNLLNMILGKLVATLGLGEELALAIVALIASGGVYYATLVYPIIAPFIVTIQGLTAIFGISAVVAW